jgi:hypothetical protein
MKFINQREVSLSMYESSIIDLSSHVNFAHQRIKIGVHLLVYKRAKP